MTCREFTPDVVDHARGVVLDAQRAGALTRHLQSCASCRAVFERERAMSAALRRLAWAQPAPAANEVQLRRLLAAFDVPRERGRRVRVAVEWSLAASVLIVAGLAAGWSSDAPAPDASHVAAAPAPAANASAFVVLPGAEALPQFEHGQLIQVDIPSAAGVVRAEVLIGQDGLARAARLVQ